MQTSIAVSVGVGGVITPPPLLIPGIGFWHDANDISSITMNASNQVSQWNDKSGNGNHVTQSTDANKPVWVASAINGRGALQGFPVATNSILTKTDSATMSHATGMYWALVVRSITLSGSFEVAACKGITTGNQREIDMQFSSAKKLQADMNTTDGTGANQKTNTHTSALSDATTYLFEVEWNGANFLSRVNNADQKSSAATACYDGTGPLTYFVNGAGTNPCKQYIGESIYYQNNPSTAHKALLLAYLKAKWNLSI